MLLFNIIYIIILLILDIKCFNIKCFNIKCFNIKYFNNFIIKKNNFINLKKDIINYINNDPIILNNCIINYEYRIKNINKIVYKKIIKKREINDIYGLRIIYNIKLYNNLSNNLYYQIFNNISNNVYYNRSNNDYIIKLYNYNIFYAYYIKFLLENRYNTVLKYYDDYIINPKNNNYKSLHIYIKNKILLEVQIRDINMHYDALYGLSSVYY